MAEPPKLTLPAEVREPCKLYTLPAEATLADLEVGYATRGASLVACDAARELGAITFDRQALALERQVEARERRRSWSCRWLSAGC